MKLYENLSLRNKIMLPVGAVVLLVMGATLGILVNRFIVVSEKEALVKGEEIAIRYGMEIKRERAESRKWFLISAKDAAHPQKGF